MPDIRLPPRDEEKLLRLRHQFAEAMKELGQISFVLQGSVSERRMLCGKAACGCRKDPRARHGPYYQWGWKVGGRTESVYLTKEQAALCKEWVRNNRNLEAVMRRLRAISVRAARLFDIPPK